MRDHSLRGSQMSELGIVSTARRDLRRRILFHLCATATLLCCIFAVYAATTLSFYYYNPDSVQANLSQLSHGFGDFLRQSGLDATFQAFAHKNDFDRIIRDKKPDLVLVPSWYYQQYGESLGMTPLLASLENGNTNYTKVLLVRKEQPFRVGDLRGKTVAMTTMGPNTEEMLNSYFKGRGVNFSTMNIIITPKDADALYALALGQVDAALVGDATLATLSNVNVRLVEVTQTVLTSSPIPTPILCSLPGNMDAAERAKVEQLFLKAGKGEKLPNYMEILHINGWKKFF